MAKKAKKTEMVEVEPQIETMEEVPIKRRVFGSLAISSSITGF